MDKAPLMCIQCAWLWLRDGETRMSGWGNGGIDPALNGYSKVNPQHIFIYSVKYCM